MSKEHHFVLPPNDERVYLSVGGIECDNCTNLLQDSTKASALAAFELLDSETGWQALRDFFAPRIQVAKTHKLGVVLESPTWRAAPDYLSGLGYSQGMTGALNRKAIELMCDIREHYESFLTPIMLGASIGPRQSPPDSTTTHSADTVEQARNYHSQQIEILSVTQADVICAEGLEDADEALGIALAAEQASMPLLLSFNLESTGCLPSGEPLGYAIERIDEALTATPVYYIVNGITPLALTEVLHAADDAAWLPRIKGVRCRPDTPTSSAAEFGKECAYLREISDSIKVFGVCDGGDDAFAAGICAALQPIDQPL